VIQYVYRKYGRERAAMAAAVVTYRPRGAIRDVGKALGFSLDRISALCRTIEQGADDPLDSDHLRAAGCDPDDRSVRLVVTIARALVGFPRHLSQHSGGIVIGHSRLDELAPVENATMPDRTVIEWDKDDLAALGILKIDLLGLGMLTCIRKCFDLIEGAAGRRLALAEIPAEDPLVYEMLCRGDSIGVFQVESRAQMTMLPRLKPRSFYDLVIQVAIVRPGPIQGDMVHPYLKRRESGETVHYPSAALEAILGRTLGVPLFQEQAMRVAIVGAGFTAAEADALRRAMAGFHQDGAIEDFRQKFVVGMMRNGQTRETAEYCFRQIRGFGDYGFPESHAASFAHLVYVSAWLKRHHPAAFCAALLNSQPMGFYGVAQIVRDARDHGVDVRSVEINHSEWDCLLEAGRSGPAVRLGFRLIRGLREKDARQIVSRRQSERYATLQDVWRRADVGVATLERLADADAFAPLGLDRRRALWQVGALGPTPLALFRTPIATGQSGDNRRDPEDQAGTDADLPPMPTGLSVLEDHRTLDLSLRPHLVSFLRPRLKTEGILTAASLTGEPAGSHVKIAGIVLIRQRPATASGVIFATIEDETGIANIVIWATALKRYRRAILGARLLRVEGRVQRQRDVTHVVGEDFADLSSLLRQLAGDIAGADDRLVENALPVVGFS
jgi:error-prone DNA polymerase